ncbi:metallophosphoesterase [Heyndrickxia shackletonii]|uniref:Metallophosphoesterase n=1 Tax=Heyndrickxia shackletonii TaxID=157838 RepID=A0A0Q3TKX6_9BACI|nr:DNA repair exonuclease [Heyndrickxia shackletonii]KQL54265.1 metallophosphoesterase [Heyndrickxia shackletonii]NEZ00953.1 DNA repair exonuclease [Heyndrickxia shackletonii]
MEFTFIHAADIHLDSPLRGLEKYEGAPVEKIRNATREAFQHLVDVAIERNVAFLVIAGDLYDGDWKDYNTGLFFISQMSRLQKENIKVFLIRGNHDAANLITKELKLPENVIEFSVDKPETFIMEELQVALHGQGFASRAVTENIAKAYPSKMEGYVNIGLLHTSATGREGHESYAPCSLDDLKEKGYDYWALGHIHLREVLHEKNPVIIFPGNIQGRHIKETGQKGCTIVTVKDGQIHHYEHQDLDVLRWEVCSVDASSCETVQDIVITAREKLEELYQDSEGRFLAIRIRITGSTDAHQALLVDREHVINNLRSLALEVGYGDIWIEKVKIETTRKMDIEELREKSSPIASILDYIEGLSQNEEIFELLLQEFKDLQSALPNELKSGEDAFDFSNPTILTNRLKEVEELILHYLTTKSGVETA